MAETQDDEKLRNLVEKLIDFGNVNVLELVEFKNEAHLSIRGLRLKNPILSQSIHSIIANVSKQIPSKNKQELYILWKERRKEFEEKFYDVVINVITAQLKKKLNLMTCQPLYFQQVWL